MNPFRLFTKPEYLYRPAQVFRRIKRVWSPPQAIETAVLPWGAPLTVRVGENVGNEIYYYGIFDRIVPETIWRLLDCGETALDIGANIGQNTSAMAYRSGRNGKVFAFEPHPEIVQELRDNISQWDRKCTAPIQVEQIALDSQEGQASLSDGNEFETNRGSAALVAEGLSNQGGRCFSVNTRRLDKYFDLIAPVGVCKIDVEGNELSVLRGASEILHRRVIRDIIFEDFNPMPSPVVQLLENSGYTVFALEEGWLKPGLLVLPIVDLKRGDFSYNYLATLDPDRTRARFQPVGWRCLIA